MAGDAMPLLAACVALVLFWASPAAAQTAGTPVMTGVQEPSGDQQPHDVQRPYRGLFGGTAVGPDRPGLGLLLGGYAGYDNDLVAAQSGGGQVGGPGVAGRFAGANGGLVYNKMGRRLNIAATTTSDLRYYPTVGTNGRTFSHTGDVVFDYTSGRNSMQLVERAGLASLFRFGVLPGHDVGAAPPPVADYGLSTQDRVFSDSSFQVSRELSRRASLNANVGYRVSDSAGSAYDLRVRSAGAGYSRQLTRNATLQIGYTYRESQYGGVGSRRSIVNGLDLGGGYRRPLSFSRRTTISFTGGFGRITQEAPGSPTVSVIRGTGVFGVQHEMGRTWTLVGRYTRGIQFVDVFPDPFFVDSGAIVLSGLVTRRLELTTSVSLANGQMTVTSPGRGYKSYSAVTDLAYAFSQSVAMTFDYAYYNYDFATSTALPQGLAPALERQSVRAGIRWWLPVFGTR